MNWPFVALLLLTIFLLLRDNLQKIFHASSTESDLVLKDSPTRISGANIVLTFLKILSKYIPTPWTEGATLIPHSNGIDFTLPLICLRGPISLTDKDEKAFRRAVAIDRDTTASGSTALNILFLPCLTGPILPLLLSQRICPILPLGAVNTSNTFSVLRPDLVRDITYLRANKLTFSATFGGPSKPGLRRKRGVEFCIEIEIKAEHGDDVSEVLIRQKCWFLMFLSRNVRPMWDPNNASTSEVPSRMKLETMTLGNTRQRLPLSLTPSHPRRWATCCKDYNPIHVSWLGAKLFGFPSVIAHGNHVAALALELVSPAHATAPAAGTLLTKPMNALDEAREMSWESRRAVEIEVKFLRPLMLPAKVEIGWLDPVESSRPDKHEIKFLIGEADKVYTVGTCRYV